MVSEFRTEFICLIRISPYAVHVRVGELLKDVPKNSGGDRKSINIKKDTAVPFETFKQQTLEAIGISRKQAEVERIREEANRARAEAAKSREREITEKGKTVFKSQDTPQIEVCLERKDSHKSAGTKAEMLDVKRAAVERASLLEKKAPELADKDVLLTL